MKNTTTTSHPACRKAAHPMRHLLSVGIFAWSFFLATSEVEGSLTAVSPAGTPAAFHRVEKGDTLYRISHRYGVTVEALRQANGLKGDLIRIGDRLAIPGAAAGQGSGQDRGKDKDVFHLVKKGDYLVKIASRYGVTVEQLLAWNGLRSSVIHPGQRLRVSAPAPVQAPAVETPKPVGGSGDEGKPTVPEAPGDRIPAPPIPLVPENGPQDPPAVPRETPAPGAEREGGPFQKHELKMNLALLPFVDRLRVQVFLDGEEFAPGKVDGAIGEFTNRAAQRWIEACGHSTDPDPIRTLVERSRASASEPTMIYVVSGTDQESVGKVAASIPDQAKQSELPYVNVAEAVSERFHTDIRMLERLNPGVTLTTLGVGSRLTVPRIREPFDLGTGVSSAPSGPSSNRIVIVWPERILEVRAKDGGLVASFPVTLGDSTKYVRSGTWRIGSFAPFPSFRWDASVLRDGVRSDRYHILPPGPNNLVGVLWMGLKKPDGTSSAIGIHGTNHPETIGRAQSSGCIRLANWDVVRLARLINHNAPVSWSRS